MNYNDLNNTLEMAYEQLNNCTPGTKEYGQALQIVKDIVVTKTEAMEKELASSSKTAEDAYNRQAEALRAEKELEDKEKDRKLQVIQLATTTVVSLLGIGVYVILFDKGMKFEETGTFTSTMFKNLMRDNTKALKIR